MKKSFFYPTVFLYLFVFALYLIWYYIDGFYYQMVQLAHPTVIGCVSLCIIAHLTYHIGWHGQEIKEDIKNLIGKVTLGKIILAIILVGLYTWDVFLYIKYGGNPLLITHGSDIDKIVDIIVFFITVIGLVALLKPDSDTYNKVYNFKLKQTTIVSIIYFIIGAYHHVLNVVMYNESFWNLVSFDYSLIIAWMFSFMFYVIPIYWVGALIVKYWD